jgi:hypothetical protein
MMKPQRAISLGREIPLRHHEKRIIEIVVPLNP